MSKVLIHIPTRGRHLELPNVVARWFDAIGDAYKTRILLTVDDDDKDTQDMLHTLPSYISIRSGPCENKVEAINRDIETDWDILVVASDDLHPLTPNFDTAIRNDFASEAPNTDAVFWYDDGLNRRICCHPVIGRRYYDRDGFVFHPSYSAYYVDDEATMVAQRRKKLFRSTSVKWRHCHPNGQTRKRDFTDDRSRVHMMPDFENFKKRMQAGFP